MEATLSPETVPASAEAENIPTKHVKDLDQPTPLPKKQMSVLILLLLCEPVTASVIFPFVAKLVSDLDVADGDSTSIGYYVGLIESMFYFAQALSVLQWGRMSDRVGRKPVILIGQLGLAASMLTFGLSTKFWSVVFGRALAGFLDGNIGVIKTVFGELTDDSNRALAFSFFPTTWILGSTIAPLMGGALQHPAERFPSVFGGSAFWIKHPYFLPCLCVAGFCGFTFLLGLLLLEETRNPAHSHCMEGYQSIHQDASEAELDQPLPERTVEPNAALREVLVPQVIFAIIVYGGLAMLDIAVYALITIFFAVPVSAGGLGFAPPKIGGILALMGILSGSAQLVLFPPLHKRFGAKKLIILALSTFWIVFPLFPLMHIAGEQCGVDSVLVWLLIGVMGLSLPVVDMGFSCSFMFITASAPAPYLLGSVNGLAQTLVSIVRAVGPAGTTAAFALSTKTQWMGGYGVYWVFCILTGLVISSTTLLPKIEKRTGPNS